jgi:hypothetical protein
MPGLTPELFLPEPPSITSETARVDMARPSSEPPPADSSAEKPLSLEEAVRLGAINSNFYGQFFFPRTFKLKSPAFHQDLWNELESPRHRYFAAMVFRDGAKTSLLRVYTSKRIAYGISRTILFVGKGEDHARRSVEWLMNQVETNHKWTTAFGLRKGRKWTGTEAEIYHEVDGVYIRVLALGITGQTRGINIEDHRPDLIIVDDPCDSENTATLEQRNKTNELFFGAIYQSLAPAEEAPYAKLALLQTPLNREDLVNVCLRDPMWHGVAFGCFDEKGESRWPNRKPTEGLLKEKEGFTRRNQLSIWLREMECKLVSKETTAFDGAWLRYWDKLPETGVRVMSVDPVPPPSEQEIAKGLRGKDDEALVVVQRTGEDYYVCAVEANTGHEPDWTVATFYTMAIRWNPLRCVVESVAYQRTLAWLIRKAAKIHKRYFVIEEFTDKRKKFDRIVDALSGIASEGHLYVHASMDKLISQFSDYPETSHDDVLEAVAVAVMKLETLESLAHSEAVIGDLEALPRPRIDFRAQVP